MLIAALTLMHGLQKTVVAAPGWLSNPLTRTAYTLSVIIAGSSYLYYAGVTCADSDAKAYGIPIHQHVGLALVWNATLTTVLLELHWQNTQLNVSARILAALGWVLASGLIMSTRHNPFEPNTKWLWLPALHYITFDTGSYAALVLNKQS